MFSLVGTTAVGFNLFLGGAMAKGRNLSSAQRGIAFSCCAAFLVSELILMVGAGHYIQRRNHNHPLSTFTIHQLTQFVAEYTGTAGTLVFAIGFVAAALSSQLATPLGATATAESIFFTQEQRNSGGELEILEKQETVLEEVGMIEKQETVIKIDNPDVENKRNVRIMKQTTNFVMVAIATVVISTNGIIIIINYIFRLVIFIVDRILVILVAQVFNGCLLPIFSVCLLLCINDQQFMGSAPQKGWSNVFLVISVTFTMFLAGNVLVEKVGIVHDLVQGYHHLPILDTVLATGYSLAQVTGCWLPGWGRDHHCLYNYWLIQASYTVILYSLSISDFIYMLAVLFNIYSINQN